ncbi:hypothetical protein VNO77_46866 [Canavalia gladiata]|uniref:Uncharacterized protein n=1 Tax=Canavalia gladiata TaxID=3824 RepID=A0AAN9JHN0_CANGL
MIRLVVRLAALPQLVLKPICLKAHPLIRIKWVNGKLKKDGYCARVSELKLISIAVDSREVLSRAVRAYSVLLSDSIPLLGTDWSGGSSISLRSFSSTHLPPRVDSLTPVIMRNRVPTNHGAFTTANCSLPAFIKELSYRYSIHSAVYGFGILPSGCLPMQAIQSSPFLRSTGSLHFAGNSSNLSIPPTAVMPLALLSRKGKRYSSKPTLAQKEGKLQKASAPLARLELATSCRTKYGFSGDSWGQRIKSNNWHWNAIASKPIQSLYLYLLYFHCGNKTSFPSCHSAEKRLFTNRVVPLRIPNPLFDTSSHFMAVFRIPSSDPVVRSLHFRTCSYLQTKPSKESSGYRILQRGSNGYPRYHLNPTYSMENGKCRIRKAGKIRARWNRNPLYWLWAINAVEKGCARTFSMRKPVCTPLAERDQTETKLLMRMEMAWKRTN